MMAHTDLDFLERFCKGDRDRMEKYVRIYLDGAPALFAKLRERLAANDSEGLALAAHSLKPQVNYMGSQGLFDLLAAIEVQAQNSGATNCAQFVEEAFTAQVGVVAELQAWLSQP